MAHALPEVTTSTTLRQMEQDQRAGTVRELRTSDVPELVALRRAAFQHSERPTREASAEFFREIFLRHPWTYADLPSLVFENEAGRVTGFLGILPRPMHFNGRLIRVAVATQFMVASGEQSFAARRLARAFIEGPQDLCLSDTANSAARRMWAGVGGRISPLLSMNWVRSLRPMGHAIQHLGGLVGRTARRLASVARAFDRSSDTLFRPRPPGVHIEPLSAETIVADQAKVLSHFELRPDCTTASQKWLLAVAADKRQFGPLHSARLLDARGEPLGWFLYYLGHDRTAHTLQLAARPRSESLVLQCVFNHAWDHGAIAVSGRAEPWMMEPLLASNGVYVYQGPWTLVHSRRREVADSLERATSYLTRLDGEWWLSF